MVSSYSQIPLKEIRRAYADSSILFHLMYIKNKFEEGQSGIPYSMRTRSRNLIDVTLGDYDLFSDLAKTTGGIVDYSMNPLASFEKAVNSSENYYLLYYTPQNYVADGKFRKIKVKVKKGGYRITHREGYIAD